MKAISSLSVRSPCCIVFKSCHIEQWAFHVEYLKIAEMLKIPMCEVSFKWTEDEGSKLDSILALIQMFKDLFLLLLRYAIGAWKIVKKSK